MQYEKSLNFIRILFTCHIALGCVLIIKKITLNNVLFFFCYTRNFDVFKNSKTPLYCTTHGFVSSICIYHMSAICNNYLFLYTFCRLIPSVTKYPDLFSRTMLTFRVMYSLKFIFVSYYSIIYIY